MKYHFPFGETVKPLVQEDRTPKKVFVLGVYASAVHARWKNGANTKCNALAVASEPRIFWDGNIPIKQFLNVVAKVDFKSLQEYKELHGYGIPADVTIIGRHIKVLPLAHPRQIGGLGSHSSEWIRSIRNGNYIDINHVMYVVI